MRTLNGTVIFGLSAGLSAALLLNLPFLEFKAMLPMTIWGCFAVVVLIVGLIKR